MKFLVFTKIPRTQGLLGPIPEKVIMSEVEAEDVEAAIKDLVVPTYGECVVVPEDYAVRVKSRLINEVVG